MPCVICKKRIWPWQHQIEVLFLRDSELNHALREKTFHAVMPQFSIHQLCIDAAKKYVDPILGRCYPVFFDRNPACSKGILTWTITFALEEPRNDLHQGELLQDY